MSIQIPYIRSIAIAFLVAAALPAGAGEPAVDPLMRVVDLNVGEERTITLCNGESVIVKLLTKRTLRDPVRNAVRQAWVDVEVDGRRVYYISNPALGLWAHRDRLQSA